MTWPKQVKRAKEKYGTLWFQDYTQTGILLQKEWGAQLAIDIFKEEKLGIYNKINL